MCKYLDTITYRTNCNININSMHQRWQSQSYKMILDICTHCDLKYDSWPWSKRTNRNPHLVPPQPILRSCHLNKYPCFSGARISAAALPPPPNVVLDDDVSSANSWRRHCTSWRSSSSFWEEPFPLVASAIAVNGVYQIPPLTAILSQPARVSFCEAVQYRAIRYRIGLSIKDIKISRQQISSHESITTSYSRE